MNSIHSQQAQTELEAELERLIHRTGRSKQEILLYAACKLVDQISGVGQLVRHALVEQAARNPATFPPSGLKYLRILSRMRASEINRAIDEAAEALQGPSQEG